MSVQPQIYLNPHLPAKQNQNLFMLPRNLPLTSQDIKLICLQNSLIKQLKHAAKLAELEKNLQLRMDGFEVNLNVRNFKPEEVTVKTGDDSIIVEAKCERKNEHEFVSSQYRRRFELPEGCRSDNVTSTMSSDGILTIKCPKTPIEKIDGRKIEIQLTGAVRPTSIQDYDEKSTNENNEKSSDAYQCSLS